MSHEEAPQSHTQQVVTLKEVGDWLKTELTMCRAQRRAYEAMGGEDTAYLDTKELVIEVLIDAVPDLSKRAAFVRGGSAT